MVGGVLVATIPTMNKLDVGTALLYSSTTSLLTHSNLCIPKLKHHEQITSDEYLQALDKAYEVEKDLEKFQVVGNSDTIDEHGEPKINPFSAPLFIHGTDDDISFEPGSVILRSVPFVVSSIDALVPDCAKLFPHYCCCCCCHFSRFSDWCPQYLERAKSAGPVVRRTGHLIIDFITNNPFIATQTLTII